MKNLPLTRTKKLIKNQICSSKFLSIIKYKNQKNLKTLKNHREKMSVRVNVRMSKIMCMPVKVFTRMYVTYAICRTLLAIILSEIVISH